MAPTWQTYSTPDITPNAIVGLIALGSNTVLAYGTGGTILRSTDLGQTWTLVAAPEANDITGMATDGAGTVVAVCAFGTHQVFVSTDVGATWASKSAAEANAWSGCCYAAGLGLFVGVATSGTHQVMTSADGGNTWTARSASSAHGWYVVASSGSDLASIDADAGHDSMGSADGTTWTDGAAFTIQTGAASTSDFAYSPLLGQFVAGGYDPGTLTAKLALSADLASWSYLSGGTLDSYLLASCILPADAIGGLITPFPFAAGGFTPTPTIIGYSTDTGVTWTADDTTFSGSWFAGCWDDTALTAVFWDAAGSNTVLVGTFGTPPPPPPELAVTSCSPDHGTYVGGQAVTITGSGFNLATGTVTFGGIAALQVVIVSDTTITCVTPAHATGTVDVVVAGVGTGTGLYTYEVVTIRLPPVPVASPVAAGGSGGSGGAGMQIAYQKWLMEAKRVIEQIPTLQWGPGSIVGSPLTTGNDTNVTLTAGGAAATALLNAASVTAGWTGFLGLARGGTNTSLVTTGGTGKYLKQAAPGATITVETVPAGEIVDGAALTTGNDTNVTLTAGGAAASALLAAASITAGWTGTLAPARGGTGLDTSSVAKGSVLVGASAGTWALKAVGSDGHVLTADAASAGGVKWASGGVSAAAIETYVSLKVL